MTLGRKDLGGNERRRAEAPHQPKPLLLFPNEENPRSSRHPKSGALTRSDRERLRIYIAPHNARLHPALQVRQLKKGKLKLLFLADGNERVDQQQGGEGYKGGGKKVVEVAEEVARNHPEIDEVITCILSPENIQNRSDEFFEKIYQAFIGLAVDIKRNQRLIKDNIKLRYYGDINLLEKKSPMGAKLAALIKTVCKMTDQVKNPALTLTLGVGYSPQTAYELGVDGIIRTGMEEPDTVRLSGLESNVTNYRLRSHNKSFHSPIPLFGFKSLWPNFPVEQALPQIKHQILHTSPFIETHSYDALEIRQLVDQVQDLPPQDLELTINYDGDDTDLLYLFSEWNDIELGTTNTCIELWEAGDILTSWGTPRQDAQVVWRIVPEQMSLVRTYTNPNQARALNQKNQQQQFSRQKTYPYLMKKINVSNCKKETILNMQKLLLKLPKIAI